MPRIYYNSGDSGRDFSQLELSRDQFGVDRAWIQIRLSNNMVSSIILSKEQILDLIAHLKVVAGITKSIVNPLPMIEGGI